MSVIKKFTIIGFGNQAKAWALNLRDSGITVSIGLRIDSSSHQAVKEAGLKSFDFTTTILPTREFALLTPDHTHKEILAQLARLNSQATCFYAHGFSMMKNQFFAIVPHFEHILLAPKSIASELRFRFETKQNLTAFYSLEFLTNTKFSYVKELASNLGIHHLHTTSFDEETKADLFSEQTILCSLLPYGILESYNLLIKNGYNKELAFFECFYESKLIIDTLFKIGPKDFFNLISPNALIGSERGKELIFDENFREKLNTILNQIESREFNEIIDKTDYQNLKNEVNTYWEQQSLSLTYQQLREQL